MLSCTNEDKEESAEYFCLLSFLDRHKKAYFSSYSERQVSSVVARRAKISLIRMLFGKNVFECSGRNVACGWM